MASVSAAAMAISLWSLKMGDPVCCVGEAIAKVAKICLKHYFARKTTMAKFVKLIRKDDTFFVNPDTVSAFYSSVGNPNETIIFTFERKEFFVVQHPAEEVRQLFEAATSY
ncbi:hypothetical protein GCM10023149_48710 [Mucilaginibacter gynuensis]|uniref:Uncharacterized protein n=1 Tax=Mucilaginibacter gynuensis TaxID=1302236 RepID=A0ABP8HFE2_9SPHI